MADGFKFGDKIESLAASDDNPTKFGFYVETIYRTGRANRGKYFRATNGKGKFWLVNPDNARKHDGE